MPSPIETGSYDEDAVQSHDVRFRGGELHLLETGPRSGQPVVLLHGAAFEAATWESLGTLALLAEAGHHVLAVDLPGYGRSQKSSFEPQTYLLPLLEALHVERPILVAPSMSGKFGLPMLDRHPERLRAFVGIAPVGIENHLETLKGNVVPTLLLWGDDDRVVPEALAKRLEARMPNARRVTLENAGHACYMRQTDRFHEELLKFLRQLPSS